MADVELIVGGMACSGCSDAVKRAIARVSPASVVDVQLDSGRVSVKDAPSRDAIAAAITGAGYDVKG